MRGGERRERQERSHEARCADLETFAAADLSSRWLEWVIYLFFHVWISLFCGTLRWLAGKDIQRAAIRCGARSGVNTAGSSWSKEEQTGLSQRRPGGGRVAGPKRRGQESRGRRSAAQRLQEAGPRPQARASVPSHRRTPPLRPGSGPGTGGVMRAPGDVASRTFEEKTGTASGRALGHPDSRPVRHRNAPAEEHPRATSARRVGSSSSCGGVRCGRPLHRAAHPLGCRKTPEPQRISSATRAAFSARDEGVEPTTFGSGAGLRPNLWCGQGCSTEPIPPDFAGFGGRQGRRLPAFGAHFGAKCGRSTRVAARRSGLRAAPQRSRRGSAARSLHSNSIRARSSPGASVRAHFERDSGAAGGARSVSRAAADRRVAPTGPKPPA